MSRVVKISKNGGTTIVESKTDGASQEVYYFNKETDFTVGNNAIRVCHSNGAKLVIPWGEIENDLAQANFAAYLAHITSNTVGFFNPNIVVASVIE